MGLQTRTRTASLAALVVTATLTPSLSAHDHPNLKRGVNGPTPYDLSQIDAINLFNGQLSLRIPIASFHVNGSLSYSIAVQYSSNIFDFEADGHESLSVPNQHSNAGLGWMLFFDEVYGPDASPVNDTSSWVMIDGDGSRHLFYPTLHEGETAAARHRYTRDGSYLRMWCVQTSGDCTQTAGLTRIEIESPDGLTRVFEDDPDDAQTWRRGRLTEIRDRFGNAITFAYTNTASERSWTVGDGHRSTKISFDLTHGQVIEVAVPTFNGTTTHYPFSYSPTVIGEPGNQTTVQLLDSVTLPDDSTWTMEYDPDPGFDGQPRLSRLTLPTGGAYEWDYAPYIFPGTTVQLLGATVGVAAKRAFGAGGTTKIGEWQYIHEAPIPSPSTVWTTVRATLELDASGAPLVQNDTRYSFRDRHDVAEPHWSHGLPFTFEADDGTGTRYLSVEHYEGPRDPANPQPVRTEYVRFTADATLGTGSHLNQRLEKQRTVYHDDGNKYIDVTLSDFDGLGHFRSVTRTGLGDTVGRTETVGYNRSPEGQDSGSYDCTSSLSAVTCTAGTFTPPDISDPWLLEDFDETTQSESSDTAVQLFCFDETTGFLERIWTLKGAARGTTDLVRVRTPDGNGNVAREEFFGGDGAALLTSGDECTVSLGDPSYRIDHTYSFGTLEQSRYRDAGGGGGSNGELDFFVVDHTDASGNPGSGIDASTGLVKASKDVSGILTTYTYDELGRLTQAIPESGHGGRVKHIYTRFGDPTSAALAKVVTQYRNAGNTATLAVSRLFFDGLGRVRQEGLDLPVLGTKLRMIEYNGLGWVKSVSGLGYPNGKTEIRDFDPFGRPRTIRPPDGEAHEVDFAYSGVREVVRTVRIRLEGGEGPVDTVERYDEQGRLVEVEEPSSPTGGLVKTQYSYDIGHRLRRVTMAPGTGQQVRTFTYDHRGFLTSETHPETGTITYSAYDARGWPGAISSGGHDRSLVYDGAERLREITADDLPYKAFRYGTAADGGEQLGRLVETVRHNYVDWSGNGIIDRPVTERYTFDGPGGRVSRRDISISAVGSFTQDFGYSDLGRIDSLDYPCVGSSGVCDGNDPAPSRQVTRTFTSGFLTGVTGYASITYHPNAHVHQVQNQVQSPNVLDLVYCMAEDGIARPSGISLDFEPRDPAAACDPPSLAYAYDGAGNVVQMGGETYHYDEVGRIKDVTTGEGYTQGYDYDAFGNLVNIATMKEGQTQPTDRGFPVDSKNRLLSANYDLAGNLIEYPKGMPPSVSLTLDWDALGTVTGAHSGSVDYAYLYTAAGERVALKERSFWGSLLFTTLRDLEGQVLREYVDSSTDDIMADGFESGDLECWSESEGGDPAGGGCANPGLAWRRDHIYRDGALLATDLPLTPPNDRIFHYLNHQGTPVRIGDRNGNIIPGEGDFFFPFGESHELTESAPLSPLRYTGHYRDQNGLPEVWDDLDQMHARYFGAHFGRFMSPDPIIAADPRFPRSWNQYAYVYNSPVSFVDRYGLEGEEPFEITVDVIDEYIDAPRLLSGDLLSLLALVAGRWSGGVSSSPRLPPSMGEATRTENGGDSPCSGLDRFIDTVFPLKLSGTLSPTVLGPAGKFSLAIRPDGSASVVILGGVGLGGSGKLKTKPLMFESGGESPVGLVLGGDIAVLLGIVPTGSFQLPLIARGDNVADVSAGLGANSLLSFMIGIGPSFPVLPATREPCQ